MSESANSTANPAPAAPPGEGCPTPLDWQSVVAAFREQRDEFQLPTSWGDVSLWEFGQGPSLCFLGDAAGDRELFALIAWLLKDHHRCLLVSFPDPPASVSPQHWLPGTSDLLAETLRGRNDGPVPIYGAGHGGLIALQAAIEYPESIGPLILQGCQPNRRWTWRERCLLSLGRRSQRPLGRIPMWTKVIEANHRRWFPPFDGSRWKFLRDNLAATAASRFARQLAAGSATRLSTNLSRVRTTVLILHTEGEGRRATEAQEQLAVALPQAQVEWMHTTGQFPYVTHPHRLVKLIRQFVAGETPVESSTPASAGRSPAPDFSPR